MAINPHAPLQGGLHREIRQGPVPRLPAMQSTRKFDASRPGDRKPYITDRPTLLQTPASTVTRSTVDAQVIQHTKQWRHVHDFTKEFTKG